MCPDSDRWTSVMVLKSTRCRTGSQCNWRSTGVMWSQSSRAGDQPGGSILYRLQASHQLVGYAVVERVTWVQATGDKSLDHRLGGIHRRAMDGLTLDMYINSWPCTAGLVLGSVTGLWAGKPSRYVTGHIAWSTQPSIPTGSVNRVPACLAGVKEGCVCVFTCVGWQVTLCALIWQVTPHSCEIGFH